MSEVVLPEGWCLSQISDIADVKGGKRLPKGEKFSDSQTSHPYLRVSDFFDETIDQSKLKYISETTHSKISAYTISADDLYISIAGTIGLVGKIPRELDGANLTENAAKICNLKCVDQNYISKLLNSSHCQQQFVDNTVSSGQPKLALFRIKGCEIPLAPLSEQKVIAARLESLLAQVDSIKTRLDAIPSILKRFRQSVLAAAVSGRLTEEWRGKPELVGWASKTLLDVVQAKPRNGNSPKGVDYETPYRNLTLSAITTGRFIEDKFKYIATDIPNDSYLWVRPGDILIQRANSLEYVGVSAIYKGVEYRYVYPDLMMKCTPNDSVLGDYLHYSLLSQKVRKYFRDNATGTAGNMPKINQAIVSSAPLNVPPIKEQTEIVRCVEQLFAFADQIEAKVKNGQSRVNNLTQSILTKAFRGELTADWRAEYPELISGENSAEALLERIKAEQVKLALQKKGRKKRT